MSCGFGLVQFRVSAHALGWSVCWLLSRTKDKLRSGEMAVSGDQWPIFLYHGYNYDHEDPWNGLFRSILLVSVGSSRTLLCMKWWSLFRRGISIYSHRRALSKKRLKPRDRVMPAFMGWPKWPPLRLRMLLPRYLTICTVTTVLYLMTSLQVRFALSSSPVFSRTDTSTDSERFYNSILDLFEDADEKEEVNDLIMWWNRYVLLLEFFVSASPGICVQTDIS